MTTRRIIRDLLFTLAALLPAASVQAEQGACRSVRFEGDGFVVCRYPAQDNEIRLIAKGPKGPLGSLAALQRSLGEDAARAAFAMNAGMYDPAQQPVGLYVSQGQMEHPLNREEGDGNFFLKPNGVFWVDPEGRPHVDETEAFAA
jgi:uncharacterized protein YigE (DUF2233 family)